MEPTESSILRDGMIRRIPSIARNWQAGAVPLDPGDNGVDAVRSEMVEILTRAVDTLLPGPFDPQVARELGTRCSRFRNRSSDFLGRTLDILTFELTRDLEPQELGSLFPDLTSLVANLSEGYHQAVRSEILNDQGMVSDAIMKDLFQVDERLRETNEHLEAMVRERTSQLEKLNRELVSEIETRKKTEETLKRRDELLSAAFDTTMMWTGLLEPDGRIILPNQQSADFVNMKKEDLVGLLFWETPWWKDDPELREKVKRSISKARRGEDIRFDVQHSDLDGSLHDIELSIRPVKNEYGEVIYLIPEGVDITRRKDIERKLQEARDKLKDFLDNTSDILFSIDGEGTITFVSQGVERLGLERDHVVGQNISSLVSFLHPQDHEAARYFLDKRFDEMDDTTRVYRYLDKDGKVHWVEDGIRIIKDEEGNMVSINGVLRDITERKEVEEELLKLNEVLRLINRIMRHDIKNRLTVVYGLIGLLMERKVYDPAIMKYTVTSVKRSIELTRRMAELESLVVISKDRKEFELNPMIRKIAADYPLKTKVHGNCRIIADDALTSVFENLISNAVKHGRASSLQVNIRSDGGSCVIDISDNGKGMPDKIKGMLFHENFSWGEEKGSGLGLFIVSKVLERYGGTVRLGESKGTGARFIIEVPVNEGS
ncbi:MAG: PAS domain S-box protein [Thermoplasmatota archaeon]